MENQDFYKLILHANFIMFDIKNFKQVQYRRLTLLEKIILSIGDYFSESEISIYEVLFTTCLKISMKPFIQSILDELYYNNYLELETNFKMDTLSKNLNNILCDVYNNKNPRESETRNPTLKSSKNYLVFSNEVIQNEIQKILSQTRYLYQYKINQRGIKALKEDRIKTYKDEGNSSIVLISIECPNDKLTLLNHLISSQDTSGYTRLRATEKNIYPIISEILTDKDNLLKSEDIDSDFISFNNNTEIEETSPKNGALVFNYDLKSNLLAVDVQRGLFNSKLQTIINDNIEFFEKNQVLECKPFEFLQKKILNLNTDFHYPIDKFRIYNSKIYLDVDSLEELKYVKDFLPKAYKESIFNRSYRFEFNDTDYNLKIAFPLVIYPNSNNYDVFSAYTKDFIYYNYIEEKKLVSYKDLDDFFTIANQKYSEIEEELSKALQLHRSGLYKDFIERDEFEIYIVDELIKSNINSDFPDLIRNKNEIIIITERIPIKLILKLGLNEVQSLYTHYPEGIRNFEIQMRNLEKKEIKYEVKLFPNRSKNTHKELIMWLLMRKLGNNALVMLRDFTNYISEILDEWNNISELYGEKFNNLLKNLITDNESEEFSDFYKECHEDNNILLSVFEIEANKIKSQLEEEINLEIDTPLEFNLADKQFNLIYYLNPKDIYDALDKEEDRLKIIKKSLIEHQEVYSIIINDNLTINSNLIRIIKFDDIQKQDSEKSLINLFFFIFSKILQQQVIYSSIKESFRQFENYIKDYNKILYENNLDNLIPFKFSEELYPTFIDEINKSGYLFIENLIIDKLNTQTHKNFEFNINFLKISEESNQNVCYEINEANYNQISNSFDLTKPLTIQDSRNDKDLEINCYLLPQMNDPNIFQMQFFDEIITKRVKKSKKDASDENYYLLEELREIFEAEFEKLKKLYDLVKQEHYLSKKRIRKYISTKLKDDNFLKNFSILNPFINKHLQSDIIWAKYQLFNHNSIEISTKEKFIELKLSKKEILSFDDINEFKHIAGTHILNLKVRNKNLKYNYSFKAVDQFGIGYIELLKHYFKNNDDYSSKNFLNINYEQFKREIQQKYESSKYLNEINKNLKNVNTFKRFLRELDGILKKTQ